MKKFMVKLIESQTQVGNISKKTCILHFPGIRKLEIAKNREKKKQLDIT